MNLKRLKIFLSLFLLLIYSCQDDEIKLLSSSYLIENNIVKYLNKTETGDIDTIELKGANPEHFQIIPDTLSDIIYTYDDIWAKDKLSVWYKYSKLNGASPNTFILLGHAYSTDKINVYFKQNQLTLCDIESFVILNNFFVKDKKTIWFKGKEVFGVENIEDFKIIDSYFSSDADYLYLNKDTILLKIPDSDPGTFQIVDNSENLHLSELKYYKDKHKIYCINTEKNIGEKDFLNVFNAFTETFEVLNEKYYSKDSFNVYYLNKIIENVNRNKFITLGNDYSKDDKKVYYQNKPMYGIDFKTFHILTDEDFDAKDSLNYFWEGKRIEF